MRKIREYFWFSVVFALFVGTVAGGCVKWYFQYPAADWAAHGMPVWERLIQVQGWWLKGFIPGAIGGFLAGPLVYRLFPSDEWIKADPTDQRARRVDVGMKVFTFLFAVALLLYYYAIIAHVL